MIILIFILQFIKNLQKNAMLKIFHTAFDYTNKLTFINVYNRNILDVSSYTQLSFGNLIMPLTIQKCDKGKNNFKEQKYE
jgi:hypothetical protein